MLPYFFRFISVLILTSYSLIAAEATTLNSSEVQSFRGQLKAELNKAQKLVETTQARATSREYLPASIDKVAFENAIQMLDVKTSLYNNFINNPVIDNAQVRALLLAIMKKEMISEGDLSALQNAADQARASQRQQ